MTKWKKTASQGAFGGRLLAGLMCACAALFPAAAQDKAAGIPNFSGANFGWVSTGGDYIPMPTGPHPVRQDPAHPLVGNNTGAQPTFRIADLNNPVLQPWVVEALKKINDRALSGKDAFPPQVRCWPVGVPGFLFYGVQPVYFVQTAKEVMMTWQAYNIPRRIFLTDKHSPNVKPSWFGESIGHYENADTLVVDTVGITTRTFVDNFRTPHTDKLHVVERFKLSDDGKGIDVTVTVEDPGAFTAPWTAMKRYRRVDNGPMVEANCAEGNFNYFNFDLEPQPEAKTPDF